MQRHWKPSSSWVLPGSSQVAPSSSAFSVGPSNVVDDEVEVGAVLAGLRLGNALEHDHEAFAVRAERRVAAVVVAEQDLDVLHLRSQNSTSGGGSWLSRTM